ncbi:LysR family transcriptional regulator [Cellvibrio mixtus]|uniref:LysR family transcriptional regulator n=1 Tax=Cellvibrio mixtus TaxID=39650 RepID=UPI000587F7F6|nr:LysR family transcriptional regulator [Cellvibrio mixtus]
MRDIKNIDLNLLKALDALLDERSVTRAAERLSLTQPAMSGMLTRLRESFNDPLFVRSQRGIVPTQRALELAGPVKQVLAEIAMLLTPAEFDPFTARMTLSIAATDYALQAVAVPFVLELKKRAPNIRVALLPIENLQLHAQLERGDIELVLLSPQNSPPNLHARRLFDEEYVCVMRDGHPAAKAPLSLDEFCGLEHALFSYNGGCFSGATDEALEKIGRERQVMLSVKSFLVMTNIVRASDLIAVVPKRLVEHLDGLVMQETPLPVEGFALIAAWHERTHKDPAHRWVRDLLFELFITD